MMQSGSDKTNLTRSAVLNTAGASLVYGVFLLSNLVSNKVLVGVLGPVAFGAWQVCFRLLTYVNPGQGPASQSLKNVIASKHAVSDGLQLRRYVSSAALFWLAVSTFTVILGLTLAWFAPHFIHDLPPALTVTVQVACAILVVRLVVATGSRVILAVLQGMNLAYKGTAGNAGLEILRAGLLILAASLGYGLRGLAVALLLVAGVATLVYWRLVKRWVPWFGFARPRKQDFKDVSSFGGWMMSWNVITQILFMSDIILLGYVQGGEAVTVLTFTQYAPFFGIYVMVLLTAGSAPGFGKLVGSGEMIKARVVREELLGLAWLILMVIGVGIILWNASFVNLWVGDDKFGGQSINLLLVVVLFQTSFTRIDGLLIDAILDVKSKVLLGALAAAVSVGAALFLARRYGISGLLCGLIGGRLILTIGYPILIGRLLQSRRTMVGATLLRRWAASILILFLAWEGAQHLPNVGYLKLALGAFLSVITVAPLALFLGLDGNMRSRLRARASSMGLLKRFGI